MKMNVVCFLLGNSPASECYMSTFRNTLFHLHRQVGVEFLQLPAYEDGTVCSETSTYKIQTPGNYPEENIQSTENGESFKARKRCLLASYKLCATPLFSHLHLQQMFSNTTPGSIAPVAAIRRVPSSYPPTHCPYISPTFRAAKLSPDMYANCNPICAFSVQECAVSYE